MRVPFRRAVRRSAAAPEPQAAEEVALGREIAEGSEQARRALFDAHGPAVWAAAYRLCGDYDMAQDVTQVAFIRAFDRIHQFNAAGTVRAWLLGIALNAARDAVKADRRKTLRHVSIDAAEASLAVPTPVPDPMLQARVNAAVRALPDKYRVVLLLHDVEGYTHEEIASALGLEPGSSRARLSRARASLRTTLADLENRND